ncbi:MULTISPECIES: hypothetical protein [Nocardioides]|uniref:hypothetical protein n=1 Tax=Nocardioides TaxID=1839 RepID=UPI00032E0298|nr:MULTISPECIES: hypothetical protein [Nocardioides]EON24401.1 hypothetical protein CF8_1612 [Nocardioides sp. CF8]
MMRRALLPLALACALSSLTSCASRSAEPDAVVPTTASPTPTVPAEPTRLAFGYVQPVEWAPTTSLAGALTISVDRVREGYFSDFAGLGGSGITEANQPFYVDAVISNEGEVDFGGLDAPLYLQDSNGVLSPPWGFARAFGPCDSGPLPVPFGPGSEVELCLVFFGSPGATFESVTFQPSTEVAPITWSGDLTVDKPVRKKGKRGQEPARKRR